LVSPDQRHPGAEERRNGPFFSAFSHLRIEIKGS
jgi:hypothetical protein